MKDMREKKILKSRDFLHDWEKIVSNKKLKGEERDQRLFEEAKLIEKVE